MANRRINRFAFRNICPRHPLRAEQQRRTAAYRSHGHLTPLRVSQSRPHCLCLWLGGSIIILLRFMAARDAVPGLKLILFAHSYEVMAYRFGGCRDFDRPQD